MNIGEFNALLIDPFHSGALLSEHDCRVLLQKHVGNEIAFSKSLLAPATRKEIIVRMLLNLKRIYVHMRSFPQARTVTELLVALTPSALSDFKKGNFALAAQTSAVAMAAGASANAKYERGVAVFTTTKGGLMAEASVGGQKFGYEPFGEPRK